MTDVAKTYDPYDLIGDSWPPESESVYLDAEVDLKTTGTAVSEGGGIAHRDSEDVGSTFIGQTGRASSESLGELSTEMNGISLDANAAAEQLFSGATSISGAKTTINDLVDLGTPKITAAKDAEDKGEKPEDGKSSDDLITEYRQKIEAANDACGTELDGIAAALAGNPDAPAPRSVLESSAPEHRLGREMTPEQTQTLANELGLDAAQIVTPVQPSMPAAVPEGTPAPTVPKSPSLPGNPFSPQAPAPQTPSAPSMPTTPTAPTAEVPSTPTAPTGTETPTTSSPENPTTGNPSQTQQDAQTPAPSPASLADYAGSAATNAADLATSGITGLTSAATDSVAPVVAGIAPTIAQSAPGSPIAAAISPTGLTPGTPMAPVGLGGMPPAAQAPTPTAAPVAGTVPAPAPAPGQGVVAQPPGVPGSPPAPGQGLVTSAWLHDRYGTPLPADAKDAAASPSFFLGMPEEAIQLHKILATLRYQMELAGWDQPLAIASIRQGLDTGIVFVTADGVSLHPADVLLPEGVTPLSELVSADRTHHLMGSISVVDKARLVSTEGWEIGLVVATHGRQGEGVHIQGLEDYTEIVRSESLLPAVVSRGVPDADQQSVMNAFALASVSTKIAPGDPEILAGQIQALRWVVEQPIEYLDLYRRLMVSEGFAAMQSEQWSDAEWAFSQSLSIAQPEGATP